MQPVRSHRNQQVVEAARLHRARDRKASGHTILEGPHLLQEAVAAGVIPETLFALPDDETSASLARRHDIELVAVGEPALRRLCGTESPRGPAAVIRIPPPAPLGSRPIVVAWGLADPGNVGTMIRTAAAFGWGFGHSRGTADPWAPKVLRAGAGGHFRTGITGIAHLEQLTTTGLTVAATVVSGGVAPEELEPGRYALLVGEEASGLPDEVAEAAAQRVTIPMPGGTESLNAAVAAAIVIYELSRV